VLSVESTVHETDPAWLVSVRVENDADAALTVELRAATPVMPPRRRGVPEAGWSDRTVTVRVPVGGRRGVGFATEREPPDPPVEVVGRTAAEGECDDAFDDPDADAVVRTLGGAAPPRDAVPAPDEAPSGDPDERDAPADDEADPTDWEWVEDATPAPRESDDTADRDDTTDRDHGGGETPELPPPVAAWVAEVERRCERVEGVRPAAPLSTATAALAEAGGREALVAEADDLSADARRLRAVARRAEELAERAEAATLPRSALEALS